MGASRRSCGDAHLEARHVLVQLRCRTATERGSGSGEREGRARTNEKEMDEREGEGGRPPIHVNMASWIQRVLFCSVPGVGLWRGVVAEFLDELLGAAAVVLLPGGAQLAKHVHAAAHIDI